MTAPVQAELKGKNFVLKRNASCSLSHRSTGRTLRRNWRWRAAVFTLVAAGTYSIAPTASAVGTRASEPLKAPYGFELKASNGYSITAFIVGKLNGPDELYLSVTADRSGVTYIAPAKYTGDGFSQTSAKSAVSRFDSIHLGGLNG